MIVIDEFIGRYRREYDFYDQSARLVSQILEGRLRASGVRAMVTYRAKAVGRLEPKVRDRYQRKQYQTVTEIYNDIPDLAGVRVALYFPGQRDQVGNMITDLFDVTHSKVFTDGPKHGKKFPGYLATHYRVRLRDDSLAESQKQYAEALVEIQVASVLMHAWSEVEHDLVYKPFQGILSEDEYSILDELNGMMMVGEIALERLQKAGDTRVAAKGRRFANHYELATHLLSTLSALAESNALQAGLGRVDNLYDFLVRLELATPDSVGRYLTALHSDLERRPIAEQIIDQVISEDSDRYRVYDAIRADRPTTAITHEATELPHGELHRVMGAFLSAWVDLENLIMELAPPSIKEGGVGIPTSRILSDMAQLDSNTLSQFEYIKRLRNQLVHGSKSPELAELQDATRQISTIRQQLLNAPRTLFQNDELNNTTYYILNTNKANDPETHVNMLNNGMAAAFCDPWKFKIERIRKGDVVFLYESGTGIVATGIASGNVEKVDYDGEPEEAYQQKLDNYYKVKPLHASEIKKVIGANIIFFNTMFKIPSEYGGKILEHLEPIANIY
ncbi:hypothetical protein GMSM_19680 [Geomonas sp. Red276]